MWVYMAPCCVLIVFSVYMERMKLMCRVLEWCAELIDVALVAA